MIGVVSRVQKSRVGGVDHPTRDIDQAQSILEGTIMTLIELLLLLLVAGICGSVAQSLVGYSHGGCLASIVLGFIGALLGLWLARLLALPELLTLQIGGQPFPVLWSIIGGSLFVALLALIARSRPPRS
jgi:uncharacterized membrane protein YeaQ/YmgE (transglycosylase-associated protein family)